MCDERESAMHASLTAIVGGRTELERELVAALIDPARFHLVRALMSRLDRRGRLRSVAYQNEPNQSERTEAQVE